MTELDVIVVGGGPAGLSAASVTAHAHLHTLLVDEYRSLGGQYFRQPQSVAARAHVSKVQQEGASRIKQTVAAGPVIQTGTVAYAVEDGVLFTHGPAPGHNSTKSLIVATGATERVVPIPGWTLPGVFTAGATQSLAKGQGITPGTRMLVAGSGPFLLPVAATLVRLGVRVVAVVEAQPLRLGPLLALARSVDRLGEALSYLAVLVKERVPVLTGHAVVQFEGNSNVVGAVVAPLDGDGIPLQHHLRRFEVDAAAVSDGFIPTTDLAEIAGANLSYQSVTRTYGVEAGQAGATRLPSVWAAGACVQMMGGAQLAAATGTLAGLEVVERHQGTLSAEQQRVRMRALADARHHMSFAVRLGSAYPVQPGWYRRTTDETIVCRCEDVTAGVIRDAARAGADDVNLVKRWTRAGMGLCQGRTCQPAIAELVAMAAHRDVPEVGRFRPRPPIRPIPMPVLEEDVKTT